MVGLVGVVKSSFVGNNPKNKKKNVSNLLTGLPKGEAGKKPFSFLIATQREMFQ